MQQAQPKGLYFLFTIEMWERFSYCGMKALLVLYMIKYLTFSTEKAGSIFGAYIGLVYLTPILGGYIADRYLGARKCIIIGCILMALGHFSMAFSALPFFYTALGLLIIGNGFFKPNISSMLGQLYGKDDHRRDSGFTIFYMGINLGAFLAPLIIGTLGEKIGFHYGFGVAGIGMIIGLLTYLWGHKKYLGHHGLAPVHCKKETEQCEDERVNLDKPLTKDEKRKVAVIFILAFFSIFFWTSFEQAGSSLTLFADRSTNRMIPFLNWEFPVSYFQSINPLLILVLAPILSDLWIKLAKVNRDPSTPTKFIFGLIFISFSFIIMAIASVFSVSINKVSFLWLVCVYFLNTLAEICIAPVGLSMVTKLSPTKFISLLMGVWFLGTFIANFAAGLFAGNYDVIDHRLFFLYPALLTGGSAVLLIFLTRPLKKWMG